MDISTLTEIKELVSAALAGRKKLEKLHAQHIERINEGSTRARSTTYHAACSDIVINCVEPAEKRLKEIIRKDGNDEV